MSTQKERYTPTLDERLEDFGLIRKEVGEVRTLVVGEKSLGFAFQAELIGREGMYSFVEKVPIFWGTESDLIAAWGEAKSRSVRGEVKQLPYDKESFGLILAYNAYEEGIDKAGLEAFFGEIVRVLAQGGTAIVYPAWSDWRGLPSAIRAIQVANKLADVKGISVLVQKVEKRSRNGPMETGARVVIRKQ